MQDDFPPPYQFFIAGAALNGDQHGQRVALELAVAMSDAGEMPIPLLRLAALESLRTALAKNKVPRRGESSSTSPPDGVGLRIAVEWWKLYETDERSRKAMSTVLQSQLKDIPGFKGKEIPLSNISRALKTHGNSGKGLGGVARGVALFELAWTPEGPTDWLDPYQRWAGECCTAWGEWSRDANVLPLIFGGLFLEITSNLGTGEHSIKVSRTPPVR